MVVNLGKRITFVIGDLFRWKIDVDIFSTVGIPKFPSDCSNAILRLDFLASVWLELPFGFSKPIYIDKIFYYQVKKAVKWSHDHQDRSSFCLEVSVLLRCSHSPSTAIPSRSS